MGGPRSAAPLLRNDHCLEVGLPSVRLHRCPEEESLGAAGQKLDCCILIEICADDGRQTSLEAVVVPQKRSSAARPSKKQREPQHLACRSRYEPPAVRRERLLRQT